MKIIDITEGKEVLANVSEATKKDIRAISKAKTFGFNWKLYLDLDKYQVFKLYIEETGEILGLMCLQDHPEFGFECVEIVTLELRSDQIGKKKKYGRIAGCLFAFAARVSVLNGYKGYLYLVAKTKTAPIFEKEYGFRYIGAINSLGPKLYSDEANSDRLISEYLED